MTLTILLCGAFVVFALGLHVASAAVVVARFSRKARTLIGPSHVSVVRTLCGIENSIEDTLASSFRIDHPSYEVIFCVADPADPVLPLVRGVIERHPEVPARVLIGNDRISSNPKLNNAVKGWAAARHPWIVLADSNVLLPSDCLDTLLATGDRKTGVVCSPPVGCSPEGFWAELECGFLNTYQARWQCCIDSVGYGFAHGKVMLWRRDTLEAAGGIRALAREIAEDAAATKLVRAHGLDVRLVRRPFVQPLGLRSAAEVWRRQVRWAKLRRDSFPALFAIEIFAGLLPPAAALAVYADAADWSVAGALAALAAVWWAAEAAVAMAAGWHLSWRSAPAWLLRDLLLPAVWVAGWVGHRFEWRGNAMQIAEHRSAA